MSVNKYNPSTGELTSLAGGTRTWIGTKAQYNAQKTAGTLPNNCMIVITDDEQDSRADQISYDNTDSGLEAENVQDAIDEVAEQSVDISLGSGIILYRWGKMRQLVGINTSTLPTLPEGDRPQSTIRTLANLNNSAAWALFIIDVNGTTYATDYKYDAINIGSGFNYNVTYIVD